VREVAGTEDLRLVVGSARPGSGAIGRDAGEIAGLAPLGVAVTDDPAVLFAQAEAVLPR
jgi:4-hydroxy-tetrahydrodipicolinate reductase